MKPHLHPGLFGHGQDAGDEVFVVLPQPLLGDALLGWNGRGIEIGEGEAIEDGSAARGNRQVGAAPADGGHEVVAKKRNAELAHVAEHLLVAGDVVVAARLAELDALHVEFVAIEAVEGEAGFRKTITDGAERAEIIGRGQAGQLWRAFADRMRDADLTGELPREVGGGGEEIAEDHRAGSIRLRPWRGSRRPRIWSGL